jgi:hypothetical protein
LLEADAPKRRGVVESGVLFSFYAFLVETALFVIGLFFAFFSKARSARRVLTALLVLVLVAAIAALLFPLAYLWRVPAAIPGISLLVLTAMVLSILMPLVLGGVWRRRA